MKIRMALCCAALLALTGCEEETTLYSQLEERQANTIIAALGEEGIDSRKTPGDEGTWNVMIGASHFARAMGILEQAGLPRRQYQGVAESFKKTGMVSSPSEERIRFMDALAQDLSRTISQIDGVVDARVHVVLPENDPFAKNAKPSSAAVAIHHRYDVDMADFVPQIKSLVKNAIEGLDYSKISVTLFRDAPPKRKTADKTGRKNG
ncbi:MAG: type III secretion inner membrane ring lipoprotein SctJ [Kiritimatiellae bacterium]|nr:type III secretion inner membrane ring lipoprotein SctJ [Kiritimatiellia bacterium]